MRFWSRLLLAGAALATAAAASPVAVDASTDTALAALDKRNGKGAAVTSAEGLKWYDANLRRGAPGVSPLNKYTCYSGPASNFPPRSAWASFTTMWDVAVQHALTPKGDSPAEIKAMRKAIVKVSKQSKVDARVILATIVLESTGNVRVGCTKSFEGVQNCGLMQSFNGGSFDPNNPKASILQMVRDGTQGTASGPGLVQQFNDAPDTNKQTGGNAYKAFRAYNSGTVDASNLSKGNGATNAYVSNMANYLQGWNGWGDGPAQCSF